MKLSYPAGGWLPVGAHFELKWDDEGRDFATNWDGAIQAPGEWECVQVSADRPFPGGFGPDYPYIRITSGPWAGHVYYIGHNTTAVSVNQRGGFGHVLAHANQGHNWAGTAGGWVELGEAFWNANDGAWLPGPNLSSHWFDGLISRPMVVNVPDPPLRFGDKGWRVIGVSNMLKTMGYLEGLKLTFDRQMHGAVVAFKTKHKLPMPSLPLKPGQDRGIVDQRTDILMQHVRDWCRRTHKLDYP